MRWCYYRISSSGFRGFAIVRSSRDTRPFSAERLAHAPAEIGQLLGVRYVALGSMRRAGDRLRISFQLLEAETGRFSGPTASTAGSRTCSLSRTMSQTRSRPAWRARSVPRSAGGVQARAGMDAYGLVLRGHDLMFRYPSRANAHARRLFEEAAHDGPELCAHLCWGFTHLYLAWRYRWADHAEPDLHPSAPSLARKAVERDELDARGFAELGFANSTKSAIKRRWQPMSGPRAEPQRRRYPGGNGDA